ncbi:MAG TPA: response regulator transcription factor [Chloroflexota bacterium]|nr:response regulator transcription factor [Chloroflexota bacterium]
MPTAADVLPYMHSTRGGPVPSPGRVRVLLAGLHRLFAEALRLSLAAEEGIEVVGVLDSVQLRLALPDRRLADRLRRTQADVLVLDGSLARLDPAALIASLHAALPRLKIIVVFATHDDAQERSCLMAGAVGCLAADTRPPAELARLIRQVHAVSAPVAEPAAALPAAEALPLQPLAPRERAVLQLLATGVSTEEAAAQLAISAHTVRTHLRNAMLKLQAHSKLEAIVLALKLKLIELPE